MSHHRSPGGHERSAALEQAVDRATTRTVSSHRLPPPPSALRGRIVIAAVAVGAFAAAGAGQTLQAAAKDSKDVQLANRAGGAATFDGVGGDTASAPQILTVSKTTTEEGSAEAQRLLRSQQLTTEREAVEAEKKRPKFSRPTTGTFTSSYGGRWGTMHYGLDIAGPIGTPILSASDGVVIEAGPASGFGLWVRVRQSDGTIAIYGHIDSYSVRAGQKVKAGEQIARMGNRGFSTGSHLHFEVWSEAGQKINPLTWLNERGVTV